jgi:hypothetical protein
MLAADLEDIYPSPALSKDGKKAIQAKLASIKGFLDGMDRGKPKMYEPARKGITEIIKILSQQKSSHDIFQYGEDGDPELAQQIDESTGRLVQDWKDQGHEDIANLTKLFMNRVRQYSVDQKKGPPTIVFQGQNETEKWLLAKSIAQALGVELLEVNFKDVKKSSADGSDADLSEAIDKKIAKINTLGAILLVHGLEQGDLDLVPKKNQLSTIYSTSVDAADSDDHPYAVHIPSQNHGGKLQTFLSENLLEDLDEKYSQANIALACDRLVRHIVDTLDSNPRVAIGKIRRIIEDGFIEYKGAIDRYGKISLEDEASVHAIVGYVFRPEKGKETAEKSKNE